MDTLEDLMGWKVTHKRLGDFRKRGGKTLEAVHIEAYVSVPTHTLNGIPEEGMDRRRLRKATSAACVASVPNAMTAQTQ